MHVIQSPLFERESKKFVKQLKLELDSQIQEIIKNPKIGTEKVGTLAGIRVHKFKFNHQQYLLAYRIKHSSLELIDIGSHENFYRDLSKYLLNRV